MRTKSNIVILSFLSAMIADFPGSPEQKLQAERTALDFIRENGPPPYSSMSMALSFFSAMFEVKK